MMIEEGNYCSLLMTLGEATPRAPWALLASQSKKLAFLVALMSSVDKKTINAFQQMMRYKGAPLLLFAV